MIGWGILGAAWIAGKAVIPAINASRNGRAVAIASRDPERARAMAGQHSIPKVAPNYEAVLEDPEVQAVYIPLPNSEHRPWTLRALAAGKHVLCEKPLALSATEAEEMASASRAADRLLMEAFMYRFHPRARGFVDELRRHPPLHVQASFAFKLEDRNDIRMVKELGGGALLDVGCYTVSAARWILGEPVDVMAVARIDPESGVDTTTSVLLRFADGATASLWSGFESAEHQELTAVGGGGAVRLETPFTSWRDPHDPYQLMVESFAESVLNGNAAAIPLEESIANMGVIDRIAAEIRKS